MLEESKEKKKSKDGHNADVEEKRSITEEDSAVIVAGKLGTATTKPIPSPRKNDEGRDIAH